MAPTEESQKFRKYYIEMENIFKKIATPYLLNNIINPVKELYNFEFDINKFIGTEVLYLLHLVDDYYKFGITGNIKKRLSDHKRLLKYKSIIKCWDVNNRTASKPIEDKIKLYIKHQKISSTYESATEIIKTSDINKCIKVFDSYVNDELKKVQKENTIEKSISKTNELLKSLINSLEENNVIKKIDIIIDNNDIKKKNNNENLDNIKDLDIIELRRCQRCRNPFTEEEFGIDKRSNKKYMNCLDCRDKQKIADKKRRMNTKEYYYDANKGKIRDKQKEYYNANASEIIEKKKLARIQKMNDGKNKK